MWIGRKAGWYRPYYVTASSRNYKVDNIHFYKDGAILVSVNRGWLENKDGRDIDGIKIPVEEIKTRRKETFDGNVFVISKGKEDYSNDLLAELYIPADMLNIQFVKHTIELRTQVRAIYRGDNDICISSYVKSLDGKLQELREQYEAVYKECDGYNLAYHTEKAIGHFETLKNLAEQYIEEKKRVESLTIDDLEV